MQFTENDRPALILRDIEGENERIVIIPTLENTIDDIYLLIGIYILYQIKPSKKIDNLESVCLFEILSESERLSLYKETLLLLSSLSNQMQYFSWRKNTR